MRMAFSLASAPPLVKKILSMPSGASSAMRAAASPRAAFACWGATVASLPACSAMAATMAGCWWPALVLTSWLEKSRKRAPS